MSSDNGIPQFDPELLYKECPCCEGRARLCMMCWDEGLVPHACQEAKDA